MPDNVKQNTNERDVHIYVDDATGDMYIFDGTQLVKIGNTTPQIGDKGDEEFQNKEQEERDAQIEKEKEEDDEYEEETEAERQQRLDDIKNMLGDDSMADEISSEDKHHLDKETKKKYRDKKSASEKERKKYSSSMQKFRQSLNRFIANQVKEIRDRTYKREDPSYEGSGIIRPGRMIDDNTKIPKINVYFDQSASWGSNDIKLGEEAIGILNNYVDRGEIEIDLYYFANHIHDTPEPARQERGTGAGADLIYHIMSTKPDNVIVMTDADFDHFGDVAEAPEIKVPGAVWLLFKGGLRSLDLIKHLKGKKQSRIFDF